jgi:hypothetical protein
MTQPPAANFALVIHQRLFRPLRIASFDSAEPA